MARKIREDKLNHLARLRQNANLSRQDAAEKLAVSEQFLGQIEKTKAKKSPSVQTALKMCTAYECTLEDIYPKPKTETKVG